MECPYGRKWHPDQRGASGGDDVQKARKHFTKRWKNVNVPQEQQELPLPEVKVPDAEDDKDRKEDTKEIKTKCSRRVICSRPDEDSPWKVTKANLEHTGHTVPSKRAQAREKRALKKEWVTTIKDHGHLGLEAGSDPRGHLCVTWGVYLCAGKPPLADVILSHPPGLTRCDSVIGLAIPAMSGHIQYRGAAS